MQLTTPPTVMRSPSQPVNKNYATTWTSQNTKPGKAIAKIKNHALDEVVIIDKGHGFNPQNPPKITIVGGKGNGAECESVIDDDGFLSLIKIKHPGNLYTETPNVIIEPPLMNSSCHFCCK